LDSVKFPWYRECYGLVAFAPPSPAPALFGFQNPNNQLTPIANGLAGRWCIAATLREIRNSKVHFNCGLRPTIVHPKGAVWSQPLKEAGDETSVEP